MSDSSFHDKHHAKKKWPIHSTHALFGSALKITRALRKEGKQVYTQKLNDGTCVVRIKPEETK